MTRLWRGVAVLLLVICGTGILLTFVLGRVMPSSQQITFQLLRHKTRRLFLIDIGRHVMYQLARGTNPFPNYAWSPDGKQLAYVAQVGDQADIFRLDIECTSLLVACGKPDNLTQYRATDSEPSWSPDGTGIAFIAERHGAPDIYWMPANGGAGYNLTNDPSSDSFPVWSPDGRYLAFYSNRDGRFEVYVMHMNCLQRIASCAGAIHRLGGGFNGFPAWSPDGKQLAYFANGDVLLAQADCLAVSDDCGSQAYNLTRSLFTDWYPAWSPGSQYIVFQSNRGDQPQVYLAAVNCDSRLGDCAIPLKSTLSYNLYPSFSPDGRQIMVVSNNRRSQELYLLSVDGSSEQQLTNLGGQIASPRWRPLQPE